MAPGVVRGIGSEFRGSGREARATTHRREVQSEFQGHNRPYAVLETPGEPQPENGPASWDPTWAIQPRAALNAQWLATTLRMPEARAAALDLMASSDSES